MTRRVVVDVVGSTADRDDFFRRLRSDEPSERQSAVAVIVAALRASGLLRDHKKDEEDRDG